MNRTDSAIIQFGVMALFGLILIVFIGSGFGVDVGCHVVGTELNGNSTAEFLTVGDC
jgi:hypothetical protein